MTGPSMGGFVARAKAAGNLVVQPRMGMGDPARMRAGLAATKRVDASTLGTITLDSYTRVGDHAAASRALADGGDLNGYPIVAHDTGTTRSVVSGLVGVDFPIQVRHGSSLPQAIIVAAAMAGLDATEGGPVSYCLPYGRTPLRESVANWTEGADLLAGLAEQGREPHVETFGGCMMGQLCPPSLLVAISVLEAMFFAQRGLRSVSLSYAQQVNAAQDEEAILALRSLAGRFLPGIDWHVVLYTYMGVFPRTPEGATALLAESAGLAVRTGAERMIVKTIAEAHRIPTVAENVQALEIAARAARSTPRLPISVGDTGILAEATAMVEAVLDEDTDIGRALLLAFRRGVLDVPFCLHPDNAGRTRSVLDDGWLRWSDIGRMPIGGIAEVSRGKRMTSTGLLTSLSYVERKYDDVALAGSRSSTLVGADR